MTSYPQTAYALSPYSFAYYFLFLFGVSFRGAIYFSNWIYSWSWSSPCTHVKLFDDQVVFSSWGGMFKSYAQVPSLKAPRTSYLSSVVANVIFKAGCDCESYLIQLLRTPCNSVFRVCTRYDHNCIPSYWGTIVTVLYAKLRIGSGANKYRSGRPLWKIWWSSLSLAWPFDSSIRIP